MTQFSNSAEGGTNGVIVTPANSGGVSGTAFVQVTSTGSPTCEFSSGQAAHGNLSYHTSGVSGDVAKLYLQGATATSAAVRVYVYFATTPTQAQTFIQIQNTSFSDVVTLNRDGSGVFSLANAAGSSIYTSTTTVAASTWYRVELQVVRGVDASTGTVNFQLYADDSTTPLDSFSSSSANTGTATLNRLVVGKHNSGVSLNAYYDDLAFSDGTTTPIGPAGVNQAPIASAGANQSNLEPYMTVTLTGSDSDSDGTVASRQWTQVSGSPSVTIANATSAVASYSAPGTLAGTSFVFGYSVTDNSGASSTQSTVTHDVLPVTERAVIGGAEVPANTRSVQSGSSATDTIWTAQSGDLVRRGHAAGDIFTLGITKPDATNTGHNPALIDGTLTGTQTISTPGTVIANKRIEGYVVINAANVTLDNCEIVGGQSFAATAYPGFSGQIDCRSTGTIINRCTIKPDYPQYFLNGINGVGFRAIRCNISQAGDLVSIKGNASVEGCYLHDACFHDGSNTSNGNGTEHASDGRFPGWTHNDCVQIYGGSNNRVEGCNVQAYLSTAVGTPATAMTIGNPGGSNGGRLYPDRNYCQGVFAPPTSSNMINCNVINNWFAGGEFGFAVTTQGNGYDTGNSWTVTGNRFAADQKPGYTGNPTNPYTQLYYYASLGTITLENNIFDSVPSVPIELQGQPLVLAGVFSGQTKYEITK